MSVALEHVLARTDVWRGRAATTQAPAVLPSGCAALDRALPGGGWPLGAVTELCYAQDGLGELSLLMPGLARVARAARLVVFVASPHPLYAPALANAGLDLARVLCIDATSSEHAAWAWERRVIGSASAVLFVNEALRR